MVELGKEHGQRCPPINRSWDDNRELSSIRLLNQAVYPLDIYPHSICMRGVRGTEGRGHGQVGRSGVGNELTRQCRVVDFPIAQGAPLVLTAWAVEDVYVLEVQAVQVRSDAAETGVGDVRLRGKHGIGR